MLGRSKKGQGLVCGDFQNLGKYQSSGNHFFAFLSSSLNKSNSRHELNDLELRCCYRSLEISLAYVFWSKTAPLALIAVLVRSLDTVQWLRSTGCFERTVCEICGKTG